MQVRRRGSPNVAEAHPKGACDADAREASGAQRREGGLELGLQRKATDLEENVVAG
jgi:hypothetical protein